MTKHTASCLKFLLHCLTYSVEVVCKQTGTQGRVSVDIWINDGVEHRFILIDKRFAEAKDGELNEALFKVIAFPDDTKCYYDGLHIKKRVNYDTRRISESARKARQRAEHADHQEE